MEISNFNKSAYDIFVASKSSEPSANSFNRLNLLSYSTAYQLGFKAFEQENFFPNFRGEDDFFAVMQDFDNGLGNTVFKFSQPFNTGFYSVNKSLTIRKAPLSDIHMDISDSRYLPYEGNGVIFGWFQEISSGVRDEMLENLADAIVEIRYCSVCGGNNLESSVQAVIDDLDQG